MSKSKRPDYGNAACCWRYRQRKLLGEEAVPRRPPGRPPRGNDSPYLEDADVRLLLEWLVHRMIQQRPETDHEHAVSWAYFRRAAQWWLTTLNKRAAGQPGYRPG